MAFKYKHHYLFISRSLSEDSSDPGNREPPLDSQSGLEREDDGDAHPGQEETMSHECDTPEFVGRRQVLVHLHIESQSGCSICV